MRYPVRLVVAATAALRCYRFSIIDTEFPIREREEFELARLGIERQGNSQLTGMNDIMLSYLRCGKLLTNSFRASSYRP